MRTMKIPIKDKFVLVDAKDYQYLSKYKWKLSKGYAVRNAWDKEKKIYKTLQMHRVILGIDNPDIKADHINRNPLDNRMSNLRKCNQAENTRNTNLRKDNNTGVKGCYFDKRANSWYSQITFNRTVYNLGNFKTINEAYGAYVTHALEFFGEFANV